MAIKMLPPRPELRAAVGLRAGRNADIVFHPRFAHLGFSLEEIRALLRWGTRTGLVSDVHKIAGAHLANVRSN